MIILQASDEAIPLNKAAKNRRSRAWSIDPNTTSLTIVVKKEKLSQHVPPWIYKKWLAPKVD
jgi:hypothetical protein